MPRTARMRCTPSASAYTDHREHVIGVLEQRCGWLGATDRESLLHGLLAEIDHAPRAMSPPELRRHLTDAAVHRALDEGKRAWRNRPVELSGRPDPSVVARACDVGAPEPADPGRAASLRHNPALIGAAALALACGGAAYASAPSASRPADGADASASRTPSAAERARHARADALRDRRRRADQARRAEARARRAPDPGTDEFSLELTTRPAPSPPPGAVAPSGEFGLEVAPAPAPRPPRPTPEELEFGLEGAGTAP